MAIYLLQNGNMPTTVPASPQATGTVIKTMLQIKMGANVAGKIIEWGCSLNGFTAAVPGQVELIETDVPSTGLIALSALNIHKVDALALAGGDPTTIFEVGTSATGYGATAEGSASLGRLLAGPQLISPTNQFIQQFALGREPLLRPGLYGRIRMTFAASVSAYCYVVVEV